MYGLSVLKVIDFFLYLNFTSHETSVFFCHFSAESHRRIYFRYLMIFKKNIIFETIQNREYGIL